MLCGPAPPSLIGKIFLAHTSRRNIYLCKCASHIEDIVMTSSFNCLLNSFSDHIVSDRRGIVTPEYRAEHERVDDDNVITNNKTYGTAKIVQPQVIKF